jgi:hypothetical protein
MNVRRWREAFPCFRLLGRHRSHYMPTDAAQKIRGWRDAVCHDAAITDSPNGHSISLIDEYADDALLENANESEP